MTKRQIRDLLKRDDIYPKKRLGQNFLIDRNTRDKVIRLMELEKDDVILEIGPGLGALTEELAKRCGYVYAVEKDRRIYSLTKGLLSEYKNLEISYSDFLEFDIKKLPFKGIKIAGTLPYYITTPIIEHIFDYRDRIDAAFIVIQKEVARRLAARAGDRDYSSLSLFAQLYSDVTLLADIKKDVFFPRPEVDSTMVKLKVLPRPPVTVKDEILLSKIIRKAFNQRRKTILSALSQKGILGLSKEEIASLLDNLGIDKKSRAETLTLEEFGRITDGIIDFLL